MASVEYDLYVDESGKFDKQETNINVVGGYMIKHVYVTPLFASQWNHTVKETVSREAGISRADIDSFQFDHCSENGANPSRWKIQKTAMTVYDRLIREAKGRMVLFTSDPKYLDVDNTSTFLSIFAKGLIALFVALRNEHQGDTIHLRVHAGVRQNMLFTQANSATISNRHISEEQMVTKLMEVLTSPTAVMGEEGLGDQIEQKQYQNVIIHTAYLCADNAIYTDPDFIWMLRNMEIVLNRITRTANGNIDRRAENPHIVPSDYICNSYYASHPIFNGLFTSNNTIIYQVDSNQQMSIDAETELLLNKAYASRFLRLMYLGYPSAETKKWIDLFNQADPGYRASFVKEVVAYTRTMTLYHQDDDQIVGWVKDMLRVSSSIMDEQVRFELHANLHLFAYTLHTHMGDARAMNADVAAYEIAASKITNIDVRKELVLISANRRIVHLTDQFRYDEAKQMFDTVQNYWKQSAVPLAVLMGKASGQVENTPEYGREIGSYLQMLSHQMRSMDDQDLKEVCYAEAQELFPESLRQFAAPDDIGRAHQNMASIECEMGNTDKAVEHLVLAAELALKSTGRAPDAQATPIDILWKAIDPIGPYMAPYLFVNYLRVVKAKEERSASNSADADAADLREDLLKRMRMVYPAYCNNGVIDNPAFADSIRSVFPHANLLWKMAGILALRDRNGWNHAGSMYQKAIDLLANQQDGTLKAILVEVKAERAALAQRYSDNNAKSWLEEFHAAYKAFADICGPLQMNDPFALLLNGAEVTTVVDEEMLLKFARRLAY